MLGQVTGVSDDFGDSEVEYLDDQSTVGAANAEKVRRLDVAMNDAQALSLIHI